MSLLDKGSYPWIDNSQRYYFSAKDMKGKKQMGKKARANFEVVRPTPQCNRVINACIPGTTRCYICGYLISRNDGLNQTGRECEHILTASTIAMLSGLPDHIYKQQQEKVKKDISGGNYLFDQFYAKYESYQEGLHSLVYDWAHPQCNSIKDQHPYLRVDFTPGSVVVRNPTYTGNNIKRTLGELLRRDNKTPVHTRDWQRLVLRAQENDNILKQESALVDIFNKRVTSVSGKIWEIYRFIDGESNKSPGLSHYSYFAILVMIEVVKDRVSANTNNGLLKLHSNLRKIYKKSKNKISGYVDNLRQASSKKGGGPADERQVQPEVQPDFAQLFLEASETTETEPPIYDESNLSNDVIFGSLQLLNLTNTSIMGMSLEISEEEVISLGELLSRIDISLLLDNPSYDKEFDDFCRAFRSYMNICRDPTVYTLNPEDTTNYVTYMWNLWHEVSGVTEVIVRGELADEMEGASRIDPTGLDMDTLYYFTLFNDLSGPSPQYDEGAGSAMGEGAGSAMTEGATSVMTEGASAMRGGGSLGIKNTLSDLQFTSKIMGGSQPRKVRSKRKNRRH